MKNIRIQICDEMYLELIDAANKCYRDGDDRWHDFTPEEFAKDCIESVLASRRLQRIAPASFCTIATG
jgi:cation transport regulator ChaB